MTQADFRLTTAFPKNKTLVVKCIISIADGFLFLLKSVMTLYKEFATLQPLTAMLTAFTESNATAAV